MYQQHQKSQQVKQNIRTQKLQEPQQTEQHVQLTPDLKQLEQQFEEKLAITSAIDQHVMQSQLIVEELQVFLIIFFKKKKSYQSKSELNILFLFFM